MAGDAKKNKKKKSNPCGSAGQGSGHTRHKASSCSQGCQPSRCRQEESADEGRCWNNTLSRTHRLHRHQSSSHSSGSICGCCGSCLGIQRSATCSGSQWLLGHGWARWGGIVSRSKHHGGFYGIQGQLCGASSSSIPCKASCEHSFERGEHASAPQAPPTTRWDSTRIGTSKAATSTVQSEAGRESCQYHGKACEQGRSSPTAIEYFPTCRTHPACGSCRDHQSAGTPSRLVAGWKGGPSIA